MSAAELFVQKTNSRSLFGGKSGQHFEFSNFKRLTCD